MFQTKKKRYSAQSQFISINSNEESFRRIEYRIYFSIAECTSTYQSLAAGGLQCPLITDVELLLSFSRKLIPILYFEIF